nr:aminoglycoside phosphotransferase family protein [Phytoactinopolyspora mesophila]
MTKRHLSIDQIQALLRHSVGPHAELRDCTEVTDGFFNAVYAVTVRDGQEDNGQELVLKVAPDPGTKLLRYEVDLMHTEAEFFARAGAAGVPLPELIAAEPDAGYLLMRRLAGQTLHHAREAMTPPQLRSIRHELGVICSRLAHMTGPSFGYPRRDGHTRTDSWRTSFLVMVDDILADAVEYGRELPEPPAVIRARIETYTGALDEVTVPALVHFDLWDGNVFVVPDGDTYRVEGIIDGERAFYGDPIAELTSLAFFAEPEEVPGVLDGFLGRPLTGSEHTRLRLYRIYLYLIMVTEGATRGFDPAEHEPVRRYTLGKLAEELARL